MLRLVAGHCPRRNKRVELWINIGHPYFVGQGKEVCFSNEDATMLYEGPGFALFSDFFGHVLL